MATPAVGAGVNVNTRRASIWKRINSLVLAALLVLLFVVPFYLLSDKPAWAWISTLVILLVTIVWIGRVVVGLPAGVFIDSRNVISLSRMQMIVWTLLVVSTMIAGTAVNIHFGANLQTAMDWNVQPELLWLMGISTGSLAASPLILSMKKEQDPAQSEVNDMKSRLQMQGEANATNDGKVATNRDPRDARWSDMFTGEEVGNAGHADLSRIQMFFFTVLVALGYGVLLFNMFLNFPGAGSATGAWPFSSFPMLNQTLVGLIAISHGGYLTVKALPHTKSGATDGQDILQPTG